jgi:hypothetical protein
MSSALAPNQAGAQVLLLLAARARAMTRMETRAPAAVVETVMRLTDAQGARIAGRAVP